MGHSKQGLTQPPTESLPECVRVHVRLNQCVYVCSTAFVCDSVCVCEHVGFLCVKARWIAILKDCCPPLGCRPIGPLSGLLEGETNEETYRQTCGLTALQDYGGTLPSTPTTTPVNCTVVPGPALCIPPHDYNMEKEDEQ